MFVNSAIPFSSAQDNCRAMNSFVVDIQSAEENSFVRSLMSSDAWIGYNDIDFEGTFLWSRTGEPGTFTNWSSGEPNNFMGFEHCTLFEFKAAENEWNDLHCGHTHRYVCEMGEAMKWNVHSCLLIQMLVRFLQTQVIQGWIHGQGVILAACWRILIRFCCYWCLFESYFKIQIYRGRI